MCLKVNFSSPNPNGRGQSGFGMWYLLQPRQHRMIHDIVPVWSVKLPVSLRVYIEGLYLPKGKLEVAARHCGVATELLPVAGPGQSPTTSIAGEDQSLCVRDVQLTSSPAKRNGPR